MPPRAAKIAAPGAVRLTVSGVMAAPDDFGRVRVLLVDRRRDGAPDRSAERLREALPFVPGLDRPFRLHARDAEDVVGEFWAVPPAHRRRYWLETAASLRGREVDVEVTLRPYSFPSPGGDGLTRGVAFDLAMLGEVSPSPRVGADN